MAAAPIVTRESRAAGIVDRRELAPLAHRPGFFRVRDTATGSGTTHTASADTCDCADHRFRGNVCKHMQAARAAQGIESCPMCGAVLESTVYYIGGRGYCSFLVCSGDGQHPARMV